VTTHRLSHAPEYQVYQTAKDRCTNPKSQRWYTHGARGIEMRFKSFDEFLPILGRGRQTITHWKG
jgi:hypothetical protein